MVLRISLVAALLALPVTVVFADEKFEAGKKVFVEQAQPSCTVCHALSEAGSTGNIGPSLDELKPSSKQVADAVRGGVGIMPAFEDSLTEQQIDAVAYYVEKVSTSE
ncbi:MAG: cytochrome c [Marinobacter sp.]|uniref:SorU family sulfite dehydrogenase c-type cytochrome subunit n=1 Tax=Marinobacter sp. TaxID=50741 RepID=UPI0034A03B0F